MSTMIVVHATSEGPVSVKIICVIYGLRHVYVYSGVQKSEAIAFHEVAQKIQSFR